MSKETPPEADENLTTNTQQRWEWIGTVLSFLILLSLVVLILGASYGLLTLSAISQPWFILYSTVVLMAATWAFGKGTLKAVRAVQKREQQNSAKKQ